MTKPFVLFDLGETLVDLKELLVSLAANLASKYPALRPELSAIVRQWISDASRAMPRSPGQAFVREFEVASSVMGKLLRDRGIRLSDKEAGFILREGWDDFETRVRFVSGVSEEWLKEVRSLSAGLAIVTDGDRENVNRLLRHLPLALYFDAIVTSEVVKSYKPNPPIYQAALGSLVIPPTARESRESDCESRARSNDPGRRRVDRAYGQLRSANLEDHFRVEPHVRLQFGVHAGGPSILPRPLQFLREFPQGFVIETGPELAGCRSEERRVGKES